MSAAKLPELANENASHRSRCRKIHVPGGHKTAFASRLRVRVRCGEALLDCRSELGWHQSKRRYAFRFMEVIFSFLALALTVSKRSGDVTIAVRSLPDDFEWASSSGSCGVSHIAMPHPRCACGSLVQ
jgi:hypothetical protein